MCPLDTWQDRRLMPQVEYTIPRLGLSEFKTQDLIKEKLSEMLAEAGGSRSLSPEFVNNPDGSITGRWSYRPPMVP